mgnify:CR=1 FL=1
MGGGERGAAPKRLHPVRNEGKRMSGRRRIAATRGRRTKRTTRRRNEEKKEEG